MTRPSRTLAACAGALAVAASGCGQQQIEVASDDPLHRGAVLFYERCSGCHTLDAAGSAGSAPQVSKAERTDGPNFNVKPETVDSVLFAIRNGGFSGAIMPANIVVGRDAEDVARFVAEYAGRDAPASIETTAAPEGSAETTGGGTTAEEGGAGKGRRGDSRGRGRE